jgi:hypothetical protein
MSDSPLPPPPPWAPPEQDHSTAPAPAQHQRPGLQLPPLSPAGWLATAGTSLLLVASVIVVAGNWAAIDPRIRLAGLVASLVAVYFAAEAGRRLLPTTSRALAALAALLTAPVGVAASATLSQPWPVCTLVGGLAALGATHVQSRRWHVPALTAATVAAFSLAAVGASALTSVPVIIIGAAGSAVGLALGAPRRSVGLAVAVGCSPVATGLAAIGVGPGTLGRLGLTADQLAWTAPLSCTVAAAVIAVVARRHDNAPLAVVAIGTFSAGVSAGFIAGNVSGAAWWSIPAVAVLVGEAVGARTDDSIWRRIGRRVALVVVAPMGAVAAALPLWALVDVSFGSTATSTAVPAGLTALALFATAFGTGQRLAGERWATASLVAGVGAVFAAVVFSGLSVLIAAGVVMAGWALLSVVTPWRAWDLSTGLLMSWVVLAVAVDEHGPASSRLALLVLAAAASMLSVSITRRRDEGLRLVALAAVYGVAGGQLIASTFDGAASASPGSMVFAALIAVGVSLRPDVTVVPLVTVSLIGVSMVAERPDSVPSIVISALVAFAFAGSSRRVGDVRSHVAAGLAAVTCGLIVAAIGLDPGTATMAGAVAGAALSGIAVVDRRARPALTAGVTASVLATHASTFAGPAFTSIAVMAVGAQSALVGGLWKGRTAALPGVVVAVFALLSTWWTTGTNDWAITSLAPYGASGEDIVVGVLAAVLVTAGAVVRRTQAITSWLAYGPGLALAGTWLLATQLEPGTDWATFGALTLGVVALGFGGTRRLGAPLVAGTLMVAGTILLSAGPRLASAPTWSWIAVGGVGLLVVAALVERSERPLLPTGGRRDGPTSMLEQFCRDFR